MKEKEILVKNMVRKRSSPFLLRIFVYTFVAFNIIQILIWILFVDRLQLEVNLMKTNDHVQSPNIPLLLNLNVLVAIPSFNISHFLFVQDIFGSLRDLCECGANVSVVLYLNYFNPDVEKSLQSRTNCRHPNGNLQVNLVPHPAELKLHFVDEHIPYFYDHLNDFDLFIYTEDDMHVKPSHVVSYLQETYKLIDLVGNKALYHYSIGFLRYEREWRTNQYLIYEQYDHSGNIVPLPDSSPHSTAINKKYFTVGNTHQAMYMATREQLKIWQSKCQFDKVDDNSSSHREYVSSLKLFGHGEKKCEVRKLIPVYMTDDFLIHHMPDNKHLIHDRSNAFTSLELKSMIDNIIIEDDVIFLQKK